MTKQELIKKIVDLEWEDFEVKAAESFVPKSAWDSVSAFSNSSGGWLIFGVEQIRKRFQITGVQNPEKVEQDFLGTLRSGEKFNAVITPECKRFKFDDKTVLGFYITPSAHKPIYFNNNQHNTFIRKGSGDLRATQNEIDYLYRDQTFGVKTSETLENTSFSSLKSKSIHEYRDYMSRFNPTVGYNQKELNDFVTSLRIIDKATQKCTVAGLLFFGQREQIEQFFPDFRIDLLEIPGTSYSNAVSRYSFRLTEDDYENLWEAYFECFKRLRKTVDVQFQLTSEGFGEELSPGLNAVREALVNMLMHADYYSTSYPRIRIFTNRLEFYNPGGLPKPLKELKEKDLSIPRNPILAKLFRMVKLAENAGYGFDKIEDNWKNHNNTRPKYSIDFDSVVVEMEMKEEVSSETNPTIGIDNWKQEFSDLTKILNTNTDEFIISLRDNYGVFTGYLRGIYGVNNEIIENQLSKRNVNILALIELFPKITREEVSKMFNLSLSTIEKDLQKLRQLKLIKREGADKTGSWKIVNHRSNEK